MKKKKTKKKRRSCARNGHLLSANQKFSTSDLEGDIQAFTVDFRRPRGAHAPLQPCAARPPRSSGAHIGRPLQLFVLFRYFSVRRKFSDNTISIGSHEFTLTTRTTTSGGRAAGTRAAHAVFAIVCARVRHEASLACDIYRSAEQRVMHVHLPAPAHLLAWLHKYKGYVGCPCVASDFSSSWLHAVPCVCLLAVTVIARGPLISFSFTLLPRN